MKKIIAVQVTAVLCTAAFRSANELRAVIPVEVKIWEEYKPEGRKRRMKCTEVLFGLLDI